MVNTAQLESELEPFGEILAIGENNAKSYIIAISGVTSTVEEIESVIEPHIGSTFSKLETTLIDGVYKSIWVNH